MMKMVRALAYPGLLALALVAAWVGSRSAPPSLVALGVLIPFALVVAALERGLPTTSRWVPARSALRVDLIHTIVSGGLIAPAVRAALLVIVAGRLAPAGGGAWPHGAPLAAQVILAILLADLGAYLGHRLMHVTEAGWRVHAVHHSATSLYFLAASRSHPLNAVLTLALEGAPLVLLGVGPEVVLLATVFKGANGLLQHANVDLRPGWLSWVVATSDVHRWHHSVDRDESNTNFGNATMIWDHVFGTFHLPDRPPPTEVGIAGETIPERYLSHLVAPFVASRD